MITNCVSCETSSPCCAPKYPTGNYPTSPANIAVADDRNDMHLGKLEYTLKLAETMPIDSAMALADAEWAKREVGL